MIPRKLPTMGDVDRIGCHVNGYTFVASVDVSDGDSVMNKISIDLCVDHEGRTFLAIRGGRSLEVMPWASNVVHVYLADR